MNYLPASLLLVPCSVRSTLLPAPVCRSRPSEHGSPRPEAFSPRTPPVVGRLSLVVHLCSFASSIIFPRPTSQTRTCRALGLWPSPTGPTVDSSRSHLGYPLRGVGLRLVETTSRKARRAGGRFPCKEFAYMLRFSDSAGPVSRSRLRDAPYCLPHQVTRSATRNR